MEGFERVWTAVDLDAFDRNLSAIRDAVGPDTRVIGVIKADGYGHGAVPLAREMERMDFVSGYAVATAQEGFALRRAGIRKEIFVLGYTFPSAYPEMVRSRIGAAAFTEQMLSDMDRAAGREGGKMRVHIAVDTGMSRIGVRPDDTGMALVRRALSCPNLETAGVFTHFAAADEADKTRTEAQFSLFLAFAERIRQEKGGSGICFHCANSAAILDLPGTHLDAVRAGIILYGLWPSDEVDHVSMPLEPILSLHSHVVFVKELEAGREISYGGTFRTAGPTRVATIPVGYGDGYPRQLSGRGCVLIGGMRAPILGRVCMDQFMVDVTGIPGVDTGTPVTLIGRDGDERITMEELGSLSGRFNYELACCLGRRIPRIYYKGGCAVLVRDFEE